MKLTSFNAKKFTVSKIALKDIYLLENYALLSLNTPTKEYKNRVLSSVADAGYSLTEFDNLVNLFQTTYVKTNTKIIGGNVTSEVNLLVWSVDKLNSNAWKV